MNKTLCAVLFFMATPFAFAHEGHDQMVTMPKEFDTMKQLVGTWEGTSKMGDQDQAVTVTYSLTAGGTAIEEKLMPGTPHEMVSLYYKDGKTLGMTHYCAMGNQPHMVLKSATPTTMAFEMTKATGVSSMKEPHMHAVTLTMADANTLTEEWTQYQGGKSAGGAVFKLTRKQ